MPEDHEEDPVERDGDLSGRADSGPPHPLDRVWVHPSELPASGPLPVAPRPAPARSAPSGRGVSVLALLLAAALGGAVALGALALVDAIGHDADEADASTRRTTDDPPNPHLVKIGDGVAESVVHVRSVGPDGGRAGSGVCIRHSGEVLTSRALVQDAAAIVVVDADGTEHDAEVVGVDPDSGLALLRVPDPLPAAVLDVSPPEPGTTVHAVGARPGRAAPWISDGIVSATGVRLATDDGRALTDALAADVQPGAMSSGGALVDGSGEVVAIIIAPVDGDPTTYAVPTATAIDVAGHLRSHGAVPHGWLGIRGSDGIDGVTVVETDPDGPAAAAGLQPGDVVRGVDGSGVTRMAELIAEVRSRPPGTTIDLDVLRRRREMPMEVEVGDASQGTTDAVVPASERPVPER